MALPLFLFVISYIFPKYAVSKTASPHFLLKNAITT